MNLELEPIDPDGALDFLDSLGCAHGLTHQQNLFSISVVEGEKMHGVICMKIDGAECSLGHLYTDGTALVGSILYGAAWRAAKALGYKTITI